jgi:hypothetical protein
MMQSRGEYQDVPREGAVVMPVKGQKKRCRVQKLAVEHRQKLKEVTQEYCGSRSRVTVATKRTSRHATVAWQKKKKLLRKDRTRGSCGTACVTCTPLISQVLVRIIGFISSWLHTHNYTYTQAIQCYLSCTHITVHRCTRTRILSFQ